MEDTQTPTPQSKTAPGAIWSLILGILSVVLCLNVLTAIPGLILGILSLKKINSSNGYLTGKGLAVTGIVCSSIGMVLVFPAVLISLAIPAFPKTAERAKINIDSHNIRSLILVCKSYAADHDGRYPTKVPEGSEWSAELEFKTSTEVFNHLIQEGYIDTERIFWIPGNPDKPNPPNEDGILTSDENCYLYVAGQSNTSFSRSPLIANAMDSSGRYGANHPWLKARKAVIGYCAGNVVEERLDTNQPGAVARPSSRSNPARSMSWSPASAEQTGRFHSTPVSLDCLMRQRTLATT